MTKEEFKTEYARALAKSDWPRALRAVDARIEFSDDEHELSYLRGEFDTCMENQPRKGLSFGWLAWGRRKVPSG
jgi:hypothetical protein